MTTTSTTAQFSVKDYTRMMVKYEKIINFYNKKYNFNMALASVKEQKEYNSMVNGWDLLKAKRDLLKGAVA